MDKRFKNASKKTSHAEDRKSENSKTQFEDIMNLFINSEIRSSNGSVNPVVLESYVKRFPDLIKLSKNVDENNAIHKETQKTLSGEAKLELKSSNKKKDTTRENKAIKTKTARGSQSLRHQKTLLEESQLNAEESESSKKIDTAPKKNEVKTKTARKIQSPQPRKTLSEESELDAVDSENSKNNDSDHEKKTIQIKTSCGSQSPCLQKTLSIETEFESEELKDSKNNDTGPIKKTAKTKTARTQKTESTQKTLTEESELDAEQLKNSKKNVTTSRKKAVKTKKVHGIQLPRRVTRSAAKFQELSSPKNETKEFFDSLNWYESNKSYYDKRLQLVLDDFETSESPDTGKGKQYYDYLLLDSRVHGLTEWSGFIRSVFYAGKGKNRRAFDHTKEAEKVWMEDGKSTSKKISRILDIWRDGWEVIVLTAADGLVEYEALTREALVIEALGKQRLCNKNYGSFYGVAAVLNAREKRQLGATLLVKAREIFTEKGAVSVISPVRLKKPLKIMCESEEDDKDPDKAALSAIVAKNYSKVIKTKRIEDYF